MIWQRGQLQTFGSRCALIAGGPPAVPVKSLSGEQVRTSPLPEVVSLDINFLRRIEFKSKKSQLSAFLTALPELLEPAHGFIVLEAAEGRSAVDVALREHPDVILMDLTLPVMDGFEAAKLIRKSQELKDVPIIAVTAHQGTDFRSGAKDSGFDAYVTKPIDMAWLKELIDGLLI